MCDYHNKHAGHQTQWPAGGCSEWSLPPFPWASKSLHLPVVKPEITCIVLTIGYAYDTKRVTIIVKLVRSFAMTWDQLMIPPTLKIKDEKLIPCCYLEKLETRY